MQILALGIRVVVAIDEYTRTTDSCGGKGTELPLSQEGSTSEPLGLDRLLLLFWAHYSEDDPHLLCTGSL